MIVLYIILAVIGGLIGTVCAISEVISRKTMGISSRSASNLSWPARQVMKAYHKVPKDNRPSADIIRMLRALDQKHGGASAVDKHYAYRDWQGSTSYGWSHARSGFATYSDYFKLHRGFEDITAAIAEREYTFAMAGISSHLEEARSMDSALKDEANTIREITAKVKEDMR